MELYLDSVDFSEIKAAADLGFLHGLTTTPTFMHRQGVTDIDGAIVDLSKLVNVLHVEALGETPDEIVAEAERLNALPTAEGCELVFKIPVSNHGFIACRKLTDAGLAVNIHLIYTLNQGYMAMEAGAEYICPLVGRLHDQGHDAMQLIEDLVNVAERYDYATKVMVSSVRHAEHVRLGLVNGAHACTMPWRVMKALGSNTLTDVGTAQFEEHTRLLTMEVKDVIREANPVITPEATVTEAVIIMTESKLGAASVVDEKGELIGIFTDGDLRRHLSKHGKELYDMKISSFPMNKPHHVAPGALLNDAVQILNQHEIDNLVVVENGKPVGMLDVQDVLKKAI